MKKNTRIIVVVIIIVAIIAGFLQYQRNKKPDNAGSLYIGITDATANIADVNEIDLSVNKIEVYNAMNGWVTVGSDIKSYQLLALNKSGKTELYAKADVSAGTYDKVRVTLGDVIIKTKSQSDVKAVVPSSKVVINTKVIVKENMKTSVKLDILADQSLHTAMDGKYIFASVVKAESKSSADVSVDDSNTITASGGDLDSNVTIGVDLTGTSKEDFRLRTGSSLKVESSTDGKVRFSLGGEMYEESNDDLNDDSTDEKSSIKSDSYLEVDDSGRDSDEDKNDDKGGDGKDDSIKLDLSGGVKVGQ